MSNSTINATTTPNASTTLKVTNSLYPIYNILWIPWYGQRALYDSITKESVFLNQYPFTSDANNVIKAIPLNGTAENTLMK